MRGCNFASDPIIQQHQKNAAAFGRGFWGAVKNTADAVIHPRRTAGALYHAATHPLQTGRAGGAAAAQLGARALALACDLNKAKGLSMRRTTAILAEHFGLKITPGGLAQLVQRVGANCSPSMTAWPWN